MKITGTHLALVSLAFFAGGFIVWLLISLGAKPTEVNVGAIKFGLPTAAAPNASQSDAPQSSLPSNPGQPPSTNSSSAPSQPTIAGPFREHKKTPTVGTGILMQGTYSDGMAQYSASDVTGHLNIQRIRLEENPDGCAVAYFDADKIWFGSAVKTNLTINDEVVGSINGPTGKHGFIFNATIHSGDKICVTYFEPSGFHVIFGPDVYYHYDSYCYRGQC